MSKKQELTLIERAEAVGLCDEPLIAWVEHVEALTKQRDELLAALDQVSSTRNIGSAHIISRAAIASVKGGAA